MISFSTDNEINLAVDNAIQVVVQDGNVHPETDSDVDLGLAAKAFKNLYIDSIEIGHATDNTLTASSGDLSVQGNIVYRAGGTDVAIADGGTGASALDDIIVTVNTNVAGLTVSAGADTIIGGDCTIALDQGLANLAGVSMGANKMYYTSGDNVHVAADLTAFARTILDDSTAAAVLTTLGGGKASRKYVSLIGAGGLAADADLATGLGTAGIFVGDVITTEIYVNGQLLRGGANASANMDYYPGSDATDDVKFEFALMEGDIVQVVTRA